MPASRTVHRPDPLATVVLLAAAVLLATGLSAATVPGQVSRLAGQVIDQDGDPVAGVTVRLQNEEMAVDLELSTDEDGRFSRAGLEPGVQYRLTIDADGYLPVQQQIRIDEGTSNVEIRLEGGRAYAEGRYQEGYEAYEQRDFETTADAMADVSEALRDTDETEELFLDALVLLGYARSQLGELDAAEAAYEEVVEAAPEDSRGYFGLGGIHANRNDIEAAIEEFERSVELAPDDDRARFALGAMYVEAERWEDAIPPLETALEAGNAPPVIHLWLGNGYAQTGERDAAISALETYLELAPDAPEREQVEEALETLREGPETDGDGQRP